MTTLTLQYRFQNPKVVQQVVYPLLDDKSDYTTWEPDGEYGYLPPVDPHKTAITYFKYFLFFLYQGY